MKFIGAFCLAALVSVASAEKLYDYLFTDGHYAPSISKTVQLAEKEKDRIVDLLSEIESISLFLPTNSAWNEKPGALEALLREPEGNTRYDMLLAAAAEVPKLSNTSWSTLKSHADKSGGVVDSAYGTPYFIKEGNRVCIAEWHNGQYVEGDCAQVVSAPINLNDATVFQISKLLLPADLEDSVEGLMTQNRRI